MITKWGKELIRSILGIPNPSRVHNKAHAAQKLAHYSSVFPDRASVNLAQMQKIGYLYLDETEFAY